MEDSKAIIRTTENGWLKKLAEAYQSRVPFVLNDDANLGIDPREDSLLRMGLKAKLTRREWSAVLVSVGIAGVGAWLIVMAVIDPEPYSKVAAAIVSGAVLLGTGGLVAIRVLTNIKPPNIRVSKTGIFEIYWND
jgi:hypothetical protein